MQKRDEVSPGISKLVIAGGSFTAAYTIGVICAGAIDMSHYGNIAKDANQVLDESTKDFNTKKTNYQNSVANYQDTVERIVDANCIINNYQKLLDTSSTYCKNINASDSDKRRLLSKRFGMDLVREEDVTTYSQRSAQEQICETRTETKCKTKTSDDSPKIKCKSEPQRYCYYNKYEISTETKILQGTMIRGGSKFLINCRRYSHGIDLNAHKFTKHSTGVLKIDKTHEREVITMGSSANVDLVINNVHNLLQHDVDRLETNYALIASTILNLIEDRCESFANSLQTLQSYAIIVNQSQALLPSLNQTSLELYAIMQQAEDVKNEKQAIYNMADDRYSQSLSLWLPLILVVPPVLVVMLVLLQKKYEKDFIEKQHLGEKETSNFMQYFNCCIRKSAYETTDQVQQDTYGQEQNYTTQTEQAYYDYSYDPATGTKMNLTSV